MCDIIWFIFRIQILFRSIEYLRKSYMTQEWVLKTLMIFTFTSNDTVAWWQRFEVNLINKLIDKQIVLFILRFEKNVIHYACNKIQLQFTLNNSMGKGVLTVVWLSHLTTSQNINKTWNDDWRVYNTRTRTLSLIRTEELMYMKQDINK